MFPIIALGVLLLGTAFAQDIAREKAAGNIELVAKFFGPMPTGVAVSREGRIFVNFPRWGDDVDFTVAEVKNGVAAAYPDLELNRQDMANQAEHFISVQSVAVDARNRLWVLDTGSPLFAPTSNGGPKLVCIDLATNKIVKKILFPEDVVVPASYLNDVRFDLRRGAEGMAFVTDSGQQSPNGIIVVEIATGQCWRRLGDHPSVKPDPAFVPVVEARQVWQVDAKGKRTKWALGSDGIAIDPHGKMLYYSPLASRHLYSVSVDALADASHSDADVVATVQDLGEKGASDGLESDAEGRIYASDYEHNAIQLRDSNNYWWTLVHDPSMLWPDTLSVIDGWLYFTANQLHRQKQFHGGRDERAKPYLLYRTKIDGHKISR